MRRREGGRVRGARGRGELWVGESGMPEAELRVRIRIRVAARRVRGADSRCRYTGGSEGGGLRERVAHGGGCGESGRGGVRINCGGGLGDWVEGEGEGTARSAGRVRQHATRARADRRSDNLVYGTVKNGVLARVRVRRGKRECIEAPRDGGG
jgi:hypothetical protein